ncbi:MAG: phosphoribosyltransferase family protein [Candidatus Bathyarchaeota archaeon]|nr:phosphoribosyltransferase family protein [Candidatus Bathyarchaeota archaeon]
MLQPHLKGKETNQNMIESLESRFLAHLENPQEVTITRDGLLGVDFVNKKVDIPLFTEISKGLLKPMYNGRFNLVAAPETSGFYFAPIVASTLNTPFVPIRKGSRVPKTWDDYVTSNRDVISATKGICENFIIPRGSVCSEDKVLLLDDFIMTGNAMLGGVDVISKSGGRVSEILTVIDKYYDGGRKEIETSGHFVRSLLSIDDYEVLNGKKVRLYIRELLFRRFDPRRKSVDVALRK